ncbi:MAG: hypothetical protein K1W22_04340 [Lachnospiraceae bacterium]
MRENMKGMSLKEKIDYLWTYYKIWLLVPVIAAVVLNVLYSAYRAGQENILVSAVVIGAGLDNTEEFETEFKKYMNKTGKNDKVVVQTNLVDGELTPDTTAVLTTLAGAADVFVCPYNVYEHFSRQHAFADIRDILGESMDQYGSPALSENGDAVIIRDSRFIQESLGVFCQEVYVAVLEHPKPL